MITKREFSAIDAAPSILYGKRDVDSVTAYPISVSSAGGLLISQGLSTPLSDQIIINETDPNNITLTYKFGGVQVSQKTIVKSGSTTTITVG
jgi:hypothetical protein